MARSKKKRRPYIFVDQVDIRPRQKQFPSVYEPVMMVSSLSISIEQNDDEIISSTSHIERQNYGVSQTYNKAYLAKTAIQYFFQTAPVYAYDIPAVATSEPTNQYSDDVLPALNISEYENINKNSSLETAREQFNLFDKFRRRLINILLHQLQR